MIWPALDRTSVVPLYYQIRQRLLEQIRSDALKPGELLPSENVIASQLRVSRMTVRQALKSLCDLGVANTQVGKGTFVTGVKLEKSFRRVLSFTEEMEERGARPDRRSFRSNSFAPTGRRLALFSCRAERRSSAFDAFVSPIPSRWVLSAVACRCAFVPISLRRSTRAPPCIRPSPRGMGYKSPSPMRLWKRGPRDRKRRASSRSRRRAQFSTLLELLLFKVDSQWSL